MVNEVIKTKYGTAKISANGYYVITTQKENNYGKLLHRLIWEEHYSKPIPPNCDIHHINNEKLDNRIQNLQCVEHNNHIRYHSRNRSKNIIEKISKNNARVWKGKKFSENHKKKLSAISTTSGIYRVHKEKNNCCKQGFIWRYEYFDKDGNRRRIGSIDLNKLEQKVKEKGLEWFKV